jgi:hypothetical protein
VTAFSGIPWKNMSVLDPWSRWLPVVLGARHQQVLLKPAVTHMSCQANGMKTAWNINNMAIANTF